MLREFQGKRQHINLVDVSDIFYFFSALGRGRGSSRRWEGGGGRLSIENPRRGGSPGREGLGGGGGWERVSGELGGGGGKIFFFGAEIPTKLTYTHSRDCPGIGWVAKFCLCVVGGYSFRARKTHRQNPPKINRQSGENFLASA